VPSVRVKIGIHTVKIACCPLLVICAPLVRHQRISVREEWTFVRSHACHRAEGAGCIRITPLLVSYLFREMLRPLRGQIAGNVANLIGADPGGM
jgi:hypothetical protein